MVGATVGAIIIFLIARSAVGEHLVRRAGPLAAKLAEGFRADAFSYLLFLRLVPVFPFWLVNLAPALVGVRLRTFVAATALGIIPATFAFAFCRCRARQRRSARRRRPTRPAWRRAARLPARLSISAIALTPEMLAALAALGVVALVPVVVEAAAGARRRRRRRRAPVAEA